MRSRRVCVMEAWALGLFLLLILGLVGHLGRALIHWTTLLPSLLLGYLAADVASGLVHWFCDNFFEEDSPALQRLSQDFARTLVSNILEGF